MPVLNVSRTLAAAALCGTIGLAAAGHAAERTVLPPAPVPSVICMPGAVEGFDTAGRPCVPPDNRIDKVSPFSSLVPDNLTAPGTPAVGNPGSGNYGTGNLGTGNPVAKGLPQPTGNAPPGMTGNGLAGVTGESQPATGGGRLPGSGASGPPSGSVPGLPGTGMPGSGP